MLEYIKDLLDPPIANHRIFFFHIAKCGGTSISNAIVKCYKPWRLKNRHRIITLNEDAARFADAHSARDGYCSYFRRDLLNYMMSIPEVKCIAGHFQYSNIAHEVYHDQWHHVTVLRNPVDRWLSHYFYNARDKASQGYKIDQPIEEFVETGLAASFGRAFVDEVTEDIDKNNIGIDDLSEIALERYRRFSLVGTIDQLNVFARQFESKFHHKIDIKHLNKTSSVDTKRKNLSEGVLKRISYLCEPDTYLYDELLNKFKK